MQAFIVFLVGKKEFICDWRGKQDGAGAAAFFAAQSTGTPVQATAALKEEAKTAATPAQTAPAKSAAPAKKPPAAPIKKMNGYVWQVENWTDETLHFEDPDENLVNLRVSFSFFNCNNCKIKIVGKCQNVKLNSCKKTEIVTDMIVSQIELFKCEASIVRGIIQLPMVLVENSK